MLADLTVEYVRVDELQPDDRNPKDHDLGAVHASIGRFGYIEPIIVDERTGRIVSGHGRTLALAQQMADDSDPPSGVRVDDDGVWMVPTVRGWASRSDEDARAALVALNRTVELGGWDTSSLVTLLSELAETDGGLDGVGYDGDDLDDLIRQLEDYDDDRADEIERGKQMVAQKRAGPLDLILSLNASPSYAEAMVGLRLGWQPGIMTSYAAAARRFYERYPNATRLAFMDNDWHDYDHDAHVAALAEFRPKYATTRDLVTKQQADEADVEFFDVAQTLDMAAEIAPHVDNVILIPKYDCLDKLPEQVGDARVVLGYSVESSYGGTELPIEAFDGWPVHLLGGSWAKQRAYLNVLGDAVVSLDNNNVLMTSRYGNVWLPDGDCRNIRDVLGYEVERFMFPTLVLSLANIASAISRQYGVQLDDLDPAAGDDDD